MLSRNLDKAREAYDKGDVEASRRAHQTEKGVVLEEHKEKHRTGQGQYIKSFIYGGLDGIITTFAVVAGVAGARLSTGIVLILGFANLLADGFSMAIGDYLSTKAEREYNASERKREAWEVDHFPEGEKQEMVEIYEAKGISRDDARIVVEKLSKHKEAWIDIMMVEELGIVEDNSSPVKNAMVTFFSFALFGFIPLITYLLTGVSEFLKENAFFVACVLTAVTFFALGALKSMVTVRRWYMAGIEMLAVGGIAALAAYGVGVFLAGLA
jgi:vacuolar iron transporter family protein